MNMPPAVSYQREHPVQRIVITFLNLLMVIAGLYSIQMLVSIYQKSRQQLSAASPLLYFPQQPHTLMSHAPADTP